MKYVFDNLYEVCNDAFCCCCNNTNLLKKIVITYLKLFMNKCLYVFTDLMIFWFVSRLDLTDDSVFVFVRVMQYLRMCYRLFLDCVWFCL